MALFDHNPPSNKLLLNQLFVGRQIEREILAERIPGELSSDAILAVHGSSRVGKSHLALWFLHQPELRERYYVFVVKAANGRTARQILLDLYEAVRTEIQAIQEPAELIHEPGEPEGLGSLNILNEVRELIAIFDGLITGDETEREVSYSDAFEHSFAFKILANILSLGISSELGGGTKETRTETHRVKRAPPNDYRLASIIRELCEVLCQASPKRSVIIYIDDVDLLDVGPEQDQKEVVVLTRLLSRLAESTCIAVVASLRTRHLANKHKAFSEALRVRAMTDEELKNVYQNHLKVHDLPIGVFDEECISELVKSASGHVGNFLRQCFKFRDWGRVNGKLGTGQLLNVTHFKDFVLDEVREFSSRPDLKPYVDAIVAAVRRIPPLLEVALNPEVLGTELVYTLLEEPGGAGPQKVYTINGFVARVLREKT